MISQNKLQSQVKNTTIHEIGEYVRNWSPGMKRAFLVILKANKKYKKLYFSQGWAARECGLHRVTVNIYFKHLHELGLMKKIYRQSKTCIYELTDIAKNPTGLLKQLLHLLCFFGMSTLCSTPLTPPYTHYPTQVKIIKNNSNLKSNTFIDKYTSIINNRPTVVLKKEDFVPDIVKELHDLKLTPAQKYKIGCFPIEALKWAVIMLGYTKRSYVCLKYFSEEFCRKNGIKPSWRPFYLAMELWPEDFGDCKVVNGNFSLANTKETQKEESMLSSAVQSGPKLYVRPALSADYIRLLNTSPIEVFKSQYQQFLDTPNHFLSEHVRWTMGVSNMVKASFWSFLGSQNISPIKILYHIESLMEIGGFLDILNTWGPAGAAKFLFLCLESAHDQQQDKMVVTSSRYKPRDEERIKCEVIEMGLQLQDFMNGDCYKMMKDIIGEDILKQNIYTLVNNWIKIAN